MKREVKNLPASVLARLKNYANETHRTFNEVLTYYGLERFLYRLSKSEYIDQFVLKGALVMLTWSRGPARSTRDIDLSASMEPTVDAVTAAIARICEVDVEPDGIEFDAESIRGQEIVERAEYPGVRVRIDGQIGNARVHLRIDIAFGETIVPEPEPIDYPTILDLPAPQLNAYRPETIVAEKLEAIVQLGEVNTRMKDFYDLHKIAASLEIDGRTLVEAIKTTFGARHTDVPRETPTGLANDFGSRHQPGWQAFLERIAEDGDSFSTLAEVVEELQSFAGPVLRAARADAVFDSSWKHEQGWT
ncbi:MAG: nucleotidyl transferase AbiEii/AbiGii toxin family protein [Anaerolineales bacterium]